MSIPVEVDQIATEMERFGTAAYVLTVRDDATPHIAHVSLTVVDGTLRCAASRTAARNVVDRPTMSVLWPPFEPNGYSMIVDATAQVDGETMILTPSKGVLHRPAEAPDGATTACGSDCNPLGA